MAYNKVLITNGERLGIKDPLVIQKADGFLRVLNSKPIAKTVSDAAKIILCLDLAANNIGVAFDKETALKLTGLRKNVYQNSLNNLEKILNLDKPVTVSELCVQFSCSEAKNLALKIFESYKRKDSNVNYVEHPQYAAASVYTSCKLNSIKVDKSQFKLVSRLKAAQWNELIDEFTKFANSLGLFTMKKRDKQKNASVEHEAMEEDFLVKTKIKEKDEEIEAYEVWKDRILREASEQILQKELSE